MLQDMLEQLLFLKKVVPASVSAGSPLQARHCCMLYTTNANDKWLCTGAVALG